MGYLRSEDGNHKTKDELIAMLKKAASYSVDLLLNTESLESGEIYLVDTKIRTKGWTGILNNNYMLD